MPDSSPEAYDLIARAVFAHDASPPTLARIVALGEAAVPPLQDALALGDAVGRRIGVLGLAAIHSRAVVAPLLNFVAVAGPDETDLAPIALAGATRQLGPDDLPRLLAFARELALRPDAATRRATVELCARVGIDEPPLLALAADPDASVAEAARGALESRPSTDEPLALLAALLCADPAVRQPAIDALRARPDAGALVARLLAHPAPTVAERACALAADRAELLPALVDRARDARNPPALRRAALGALPLANPAEYPPVRPLLGEALATTDPAMRAAAAAAIGRSAHPLALRDAHGLLLDPDLTVVMAVADAWARLGGRERGLLVPPAVELLEQWAWHRAADPAIVGPASALLRALLGAHIAGVPLEERVPQAVWRYTGAPNERLRALARRVHAALLSPPEPADSAERDPVLAALESGGPEALEHACAALEAAPPERVELYVEPLLAAALVAPDPGLIALCGVLGRSRGARATAFLRRLLAHAGAEVRMAARAALPPGDAP